MQCLTEKSARSIQQFLAGNNNIHIVEKTSPEESKLSTLSLISYTENPGKIEAIAYKTCRGWRACWPTAP